MTGEATTGYRVALGVWPLTGKRADPVYRAKKIPISSSSLPLLMSVVTNNGGGSVTDAELSGGRMKSLGSASPDVIPGVARIIITAIQLHPFFELLRIYAVTLNTRF